MALSRDQILASKPRTQRVETPELDGGFVNIRGMSGRDRDEYLREVYALLDASPDDKYANGKNLSARVARRVLCDDAGALLFTETDEAALGALDGAALERIKSAGLLLSGIGREADDSSKGKSSPAPSGGPSSTSPSS